MGQLLRLSLTCLFYSFFIGTFGLEILSVSPNKTIVLNPGDQLLLKILYSFNTTEFRLKSKWNYVERIPSLNEKFRQITRIRSNDRKRMSNTRSVSPGIFEESLSFKSVTSRDQGIYELTLESGNDSSIHTFPDVFVSRKAEVITVELQNDRLNPRFLQNYNEYVLECHTKGYPFPNIWWEYKRCADNREFTCCEQWQGISSDESFKISSQIQGTVVKVSKIIFKADNYRLIRCSARNDPHNVDSKIFSYISTDIPESEKSSGFSIVSSSEEIPFETSNIQLHCAVQKFDFTSIEWRNDKEKTIGSVFPSIETSDKSDQNFHVFYNTSNPTTNVVTLEFLSLSVNDSGNYSCYAAYHKLLLKRTFLLQVFEKPHFNLSSSVTNITLELLNELDIIPPKSPKAIKVLGIFALILAASIVLFLLYFNRTKMSSCSQP